MRELIKTEATETLADELIGAAQILERLAASLKSDAKTIRRNGLIKFSDDCPIANQRMHKHFNVANACERAQSVIKYANR